MAVPVPVAAGDDEGNGCWSVLGPVVLAKCGPYYPPGVLWPRVDVAEAAVMLLCYGYSSYYYNTHAASLS